MSYHEQRCRRSKKIKSKRCGGAVGVVCWYAKYGTILMADFSPIIAYMYMCIWHSAINGIFLLEWHKTLVAVNKNG